jgi:hypothetical protein
VELDQLLAPIALYPDALIALILPAASSPADIVLAARQVRSSGSDRAQVEHRSWDESVKSLVNYPEVLQWLDENLQWTKQVGEAFAEQPVDVMQAIQRLRAQARAAGTLVDTPEQTVLTDLEVIRIVPAQAEVLYVPYYEPSLVFVDRPSFSARPFVTFGVGLPVGSWLAFECDWRRHTIWVGNRHRRWQRHDWRQPLVPIPVVATPTARYRDVRPWHPPASLRRPPLPPPRTFAAPSYSAPVVTNRSVGNEPRHQGPRPPGTVGTSRHPSRPSPSIAGPSLPPPSRAVLAPPLTTVPFAQVPARPVPAKPNLPGASSSPYHGTERNRPSSPSIDSGNNRGRHSYASSDRARPAPSTPGIVAAPARSLQPSPTLRPNYAGTRAPAPGYSPSAPVANRHRPAPAATPPTVAPVTTPAASAPAARPEGESERSIGRRPPHEHQR